MAVKGQLMYRQMGQVRLICIRPSNSWTLMGQTLPKPNHPANCIVALTGRRPWRTSPPR